MTDSNKHPCELSPGQFDHDWEYVDDSVDHEYGTEIINYLKCAVCGQIRETQYDDF